MPMQPQRQPHPCYAQQPHPQAPLPSTCSDIMQDTRGMGTLQRSSSVPSYMGESPAYNQSGKFSRDITSHTNHIATVCTIRGASLSMSDRLHHLPHGARPAPPYEALAIFAYIAGDESARAHVVEYAGEQSRVTWAASAPVVNAPVVNAE